MFGNMKRGPLFDEASGSTTLIDPASPAATVPATPPVTETPEPDDKDFDTWLAAQPKAVQEKFAEKYGKLNTAIKKERDANKLSKPALAKLAQLEADEKKRADAQLTEKQKLEKRAVEAEARAATATATANEKVLKTAVLLKAASMNFENPADAFDLAKTRDLFKDLQPGADGEYDEASIEAALKPLIGRLPVKTQGSGIGSPQLRQAHTLPPSVSAEKEKQRREYERIVRMK